MSQAIEIRSWAELQVALRQRAETLDVSREVLDHLTGLQSGYCAKLLAPHPIRRLGRIFFLWKLFFPAPTKLDRLAKRLKKEVSQSGIAPITILDNRDRRLADDLARKFKTHGWELNYTKTAQAKVYVEGIIVAGFNEGFVKRIAKIFRKSGFENIRVEIQELEIPRENPKWDSAQRRVNITIGHHTF